MVDLDVLIEQNKDFILELANKNGHHLPDGTLTVDKNDPWMINRMELNREDKYAQ